jgi:hypothetical protein
MTVVAFNKNNIENFSISKGVLRTIIAGKQQIKILLSKTRCAVLHDRSILPRLLQKKPRDLLLNMHEVVRYYGQNTTRLLQQENGGYTVS